MTRNRYEIADLAQAQERATFARAGLNWLPVRVLTYHAPETVEGVKLGASVTCQPLLEYVRIINAPEEGAPPLRLAPGERLLSAEDGRRWTGAGDTSARRRAIARPFEPVRVPVLFAGGSALAACVEPQAGDLGVLLLAGRNLADALEVGEDPVLPEFPPNPLRLSDGVYLGHMLAGAADVPAEAGPAAGGDPQLGPRDNRAGSVYLRLAGEEWTLEGSAIKLGANASKGVGRIGDKIALDAAALAQLNAALASAAGGVPPATITSLEGTITEGSGTVTAKD